MPCQHFFAGLAGQGRIFVCTTWVLPLSCNVSAVNFLGDKSGHFCTC